MPQQINKSKIYFYVFVFMLLSTLLNQKLIIFIKDNFLLKKIIVNVHNLDVKREIKSSSKYLLNKNIFFVSKERIENNLNSLKFLENVNVKKKYPSTIIIDAKKTELLAATYLNQKKYFIGSNGNFILSNKISNYSNLPLIFGKFNINSYLNLRDELAKNGYHTDKIVKYFFHKNKRWDLIYKNNTIIKLPNKNLVNALKLLNNFKKKNIIAPNSIIDLRIHKRLTIKNG